MMALDGSDPNPRESWTSYEVLYEGGRGVSTASCRIVHAAVNRNPYGCSRSSTVHSTMQRAALIPHKYEYSYSAVQYE